MSDNRTMDPANTERPNRTAETRRPVTLILATAVVCILSLAARFSPAQTSMELTRWREFSCSRQSNQFGGRITSVDGVQRGGFIVLGDGGFARLWSSTVHTTSPEGKEYCQGFAMYDFEDGSSILAKIDISGDPNTKQIGTIVFLSGTKRFRGITGRGTISAWTPAKWDMYAEVEASYSVPGQ
ncbi:MAG: hypothetical protein MUC88_24920 [Planctomycetes bacterium]|jgi:hypothetical protein|nr:hypothetical protein [Planctomycetota bacterium]